METKEQQSERMKKYWADRRIEKEAHRLEIKKSLAEKEARQATVTTDATDFVVADPIDGIEGKILTEKIIAVEVPEKKVTTAPWRPAKRLNIPSDLKDPRFVYRFVNTKKEGNEGRKLEEGWEYDTELTAKLKKRGLATIRTIEDGTPLDSHYRIRELVVMRMPVEMAAQRNKYYQDKANIDTDEMRERMRGNISSAGGSQAAGVYADSFGLKGVNKEEREEVFRR